MMLVSSCKSSNDLKLADENCWRNENSEPGSFSFYMVVFDIGNESTKTQAFSKICKINLKRDNPVSAMNVIKFDEYIPTPAERLYLGKRMIESDEIHNFYEVEKVLKIEGVGVIKKIDSNHLNIKINEITNIKVLAGDPKVIYSNLLAGNYDGKNYIGN